MTKKLALLTTTTLFGLGLLRVDAAIIYKSNEGWSVEGDPSSQVESNAAEQMRKAEDFEARGDTKSAYESYLALVKHFGLSVLAPKAQRKVGMLLERGGQYDKAYDAYSTYLQKYPKGEDFETVVESMFKIGKLFLDGEKKKVFGIKFAPSMDRAKEMFEGIVKRAPFSKLAPLAQFNIGQALEKQAKFGEAIASYNSVVARYPNDPVAVDAQYQIGYVRLRDFHGRGKLRPGRCRQGARGVRGFHQSLPGQRKSRPGAREHEATRRRSQQRAARDRAVLRQDQAVSGRGHLL